MKYNKKRLRLTTVSQAIQWGIFPEQTVNTANETSSARAFHVTGWILFERSKIKHWFFDRTSKTKSAFNSACLWWDEIMGSSSTSSENRCQLSWNFALDAIVHVWRTTQFPLKLSLFSVYFCLTWLEKLLRIKRSSETKRAVILYNQSMWKNANNQTSTGHCSLPASVCVDSLTEKRNYRPLKYRQHRFLQLEQMCPL